MKSAAVLFLSSVVMAQNGPRTELQTVAHVDLARYAGTWYQISHNPLFFEGNCVCSRQVLTPMNNGEIGVYNSCNDKTPQGAIREIRGVAINQDSTSNAKFKVDFNLPQKGDYWIVGLDADYRFAVVSDPSKKSLYILSKTPTLDPQLYAQAVASAATQLDTSKLEMTLQDGCKYP